MSRYFNDHALGELAEAYKTLADRSDRLIAQFLNHPFKSSDAQEYARHGFARRVGTLQYCVEAVFECLPPDTASIPEKKTRDEATVHIQAFVFNVFGALDNIAYVWVKEKGVLSRHGQPLVNERIGLGPNMSEVRASFPEKVMDRLSGFDGWYENLRSFRHSLGHRIPLYIPPFALKPQDYERYFELESLRREALNVCNTSKHATLTEELEAMKFFRPFMLHSLTDSAPIVFHAQMLADFSSVEEVALLILGALKD